VRLPRQISAGAARRRALLFDALAGIAIAVVLIALCAGLGIVGAIALVALLVGLIWTAVEYLLSRRRRRPGRL
jgi:Flp pilus assembly protein TadB